MEFAASAFELKSLDDAGAIEGVAAGFGNVDAGGDKVLFGAFTKSLAARAGRPIPMLLYHDQSRPIGAWREWKEMPDGLYVKGRITRDTRDGQEALALARDGAFGGLSMGYRPTPAARIERNIRVLPEVDLYEASLVTIPMNDRAVITDVKSIGGARDIEEILRTGGISSRRAKAAASLAWKAINQDAPDDDANNLAQLLEASIRRLSA